MTPAPLLSRTWLRVYNPGDWWRDPLNSWDYFNPGQDGKNRVDGILLVVHQFHKDSSNPAYNVDTDRTLVGPNAWNLGAPNGQQRLDDILNQVHQFHNDCS